MCSYNKECWHSVGRRKLLRHMSCRVKLPTLQYGVAMKRRAHRRACPQLEGLGVRCETSHSESARSWWSSAGCPGYATRMGTAAPPPYDFLFLQFFTVPPCVTRTSKFIQYCRQPLHDAAAGAQEKRPATAPKGSKSSMSRSSFSPAVAKRPPIRSRDELARNI